MHSKGEYLSLIESASSSFFSLNNKTKLYKEKDRRGIYLFPKVNKFGMINRPLTYHKILFTIIKIDRNKNDISLIITCNHEKISHPSFNLWQKHNFSPYILGTHRHSLFGLYD